MPTGFPPRRGEIWYVALDPAQGAEIQKMRPCIVVSEDDLSPLPLRVVVPVTTWQPKFHAQPWKVRIAPATETGLTNDSAADTLQIRSVDLQRFNGYIGLLTPETLEMVIDATFYMLGV